VVSAAFYDPGPTSSLAHRSVSRCLCPIGIAIRDQREGSILAGPFLARPRQSADQALGCARSRAPRVSAVRFRSFVHVSDEIVGETTITCASGQPGLRFALTRLAGFQFLIPPAIRPVPRTGALVSRAAPASAEKSGSSRACARVPPDFTAPAPCVGSPSGRRRAAALSCSTQPKSMGAFRTDRSVEASATGGKRAKAESLNKTSTAPLPL
jgi:hypothetical protein